ncbi:hypothetical protein BCR35DRAFT_222139 [Leucosporidium creatinivorum]|uniref:Uncharacterized protein n=1 Tax=Leucosporidium creatinivorum TaxID=106004 RepID=A0A1Y2D7U2_9BASI|nr:hypothetical protein BCR35DRAFT_222139 [Leucosporidium creatinivorum]
MATNSHASDLVPPSLPPSIIRSASLSPARPMPSPRFDQPPSAFGHPDASGSVSPALLSPSPAPPTSSILLNKPQSPGPASTSNPASPQPDDSPGAGAIAGLGLRVASPEGLHDSIPTTTTSTSPLVSPPSQSHQPAPSTQATTTAPTPASYFADQQQQAAEAMGRPSRSPSPHCHFAPLPNVEASRPGTRRNSAAQGPGRVKPFVGKEGGGELHLGTLLQGQDWTCRAS